MDRAQELQVMSFGDRRMYARSLGIEVSKKQIKDLIVEIIQVEEELKDKEKVAKEVAVDIGTVCQDNDEVIVVENNAVVEADITALKGRITELETKNEELVSKISSLEEDINGAFTQISKIVVELGWPPLFPSNESVCQVAGLDVCKVDDIGADSDITRCNNGEGITAVPSTSKREGKEEEEEEEDKEEEEYVSNYPSIQVIQNMRLSDLKKVAQTIALDKDEKLPASIQTKKQLLEYVITGLSSLEEGK